MDLSAAQARPLFDQLAALPIAAGYERAMRGDIAFGLGVFGRMRRDPGEALSLAGDNSPFSLILGRMTTSPLCRPYWNLEEANYIRQMDRTLEVGRQPYRLSAGADPAEHRRTAFGEVMVAILLPVLAKVSLKRDECLADVGLLQTALALKAYRHEHGAYPAALTDLTWKVPGDRSDFPAVAAARRYAGRNRAANGTDRPPGAPPGWSASPSRSSHG